MGIIFSFLVVVALAFVAALVWGFVLVKVWGWFVAPVFGLPTLSVIEAFGISLLLAYAVRANEQYIDPKYRDTKQEIINVVERPLAVLLLAWIAHSLFM